MNSCEPRCQLVASMVRNNSAAEARPREPSFRHLVIGGDRATIMARSVALSPALRVLIGGTTAKSRRNRKIGLISDTIQRSVRLPFPVNKHEPSMKIILYEHQAEAPLWLDDLTRALPGADVRLWQPGDNAPADYAVVWRAPPELFANRPDLKAVFNLGAGVDAILEIERKQPGTLPPNALLVRLEDSGMGHQMVEYAAHAVLRYLRRLDEYDALQREHRWQKLPPYALQGLHGRRAGHGRSRRASRAGADGVRHAGARFQPYASGMSKASRLSPATNSSTPSSTARGCSSTCCRIRRTPKAS